MKRQVFTHHPITGVLRILGDSDAGPNSTLEIMQIAEAKLHSSFSDVHSADVDRALYCLASNVFDELSDKARKRNEPDQIKLLVEIAELSARLAKRLNGLDSDIELTELPYFWKQLLLQDGNTRGFKLQTEIGASENFSVMRLQSQLEGFANVAAAVAEIRKRGRNAYRPKDDSIVTVALATMTFWMSLSLLTGATVANSLPNGRNGGSKWCIEFMLAACDASNRRLGTDFQWTDSTVLNVLSRVKNMLSELLCDGKNTESQAQWPILGMDSVTGFIVFNMAMGICSVDDVLVSLKAAPAYFALYPTQWVSDYPAQD